MRLRRMRGCGVAAAARLLVDLLGRVGRGVIENRGASSMIGGCDAARRRLRGEAARLRPHDVGHATRKDPGVVPEIGLGAGTSK